MYTGPQDQEDRVLPRNMPVDSADPLHVRACHGGLCPFPFLQSGGLCTRKADRGLDRHGLQHRLVHTGKLDGVCFTMWTSNTDKMCLSSQDKKVVSPGSSRGDGSSVGLYSIDLDERMVHDEECIAGCRDEDCQCHHHHHSHHHTMSCSNSGSSSMLGGANVANNRDAGILCGGCSHVTLYPDMFNKDGRASQTRKGTRGLTNNVSVDSMAAPMSMFSIGNDPEDDKGHSNKSHARRKRDLEDQGDLDKEDEAREEENDSHSQALIKK